MYLESNFSIEDNAAVKVEDVATPKLYPDLGYMAGTYDLEYKENNLENLNLYPDLTALVKQNKFPFTFGNLIIKIDLDSSAFKSTNKLKRNINEDKSMTDGELNNRAKAPGKNNKNIDLKKKMEKIKREMRAKRSRKILKGGYKVLAFTVAFPITLYYLVIRTTPNKLDDDITSEFDRMANSTASLFGKKSKKS